MVAVEHGAEQDRLALLASIDEITEGSVLLGETVARLLEFVVPSFADVATLDTISPSGELRPDRLAGARRPAA